MRPESRVWRKGRRVAEKGLKRGRRATHTAATEQPQRGSSWKRRHLSVRQGGGAS